MSKIPDTIYAQEEDVYSLCCQNCNPCTWSDSDNKDGSEPYYSQSKLDELQAKIDALMLEYCPEDMTKEQLENYESHQVVINARIEK